jgi:hypothetical protein
MVWGVAPVHSHMIDNRSIETRIMSALADIHERGGIVNEDQVIVVSSSLLIGDEGMLVGVYSVGAVLDHLS